MATRGALGGLSRSAFDVVRVLDAWGADVVLIETVGVGQDELEVTRTAHTTAVVMAPGMGDGVQAIKAGIMECADVFAVNKADRDGADATVRDLELMLALGQGVMPSAPGHVGAMAVSAKTGGTGKGWVPPIVRAVATQNKGIGEVVSSLAAHRQWLRETEPGRRRLQLRAKEQLYNEIRDTLVEAAVRDMGARIDRLADRVAQREVDPYSACEAILTEFRGGVAR